MNKLQDLIEELRNVHTNDPVPQCRIVAILDQLLVVLEEKL